MASTAAKDAPPGSSVGYLGPRRLIANPPLCPPVRSSLPQQKNLRQTACRPTKNDLAPA